LRNVDIYERNEVELRREILPQFSILLCILYNFRIFWKREGGEAIKKVFECVPNLKITVARLQSKGSLCSGLFILRESLINCDTFDDENDENDEVRELSYRVGDNVRTPGFCLIVSGV